MGLITRGFGTEDEVILTRGLGYIIAIGYLTKSHLIDIALEHLNVDKDTLVDVLLTRDLEISQIFDTVLSEDKSLGYAFDVYLRGELELIVSQVIDTLVAQGVDVTTLFDVLILPKGVKLKTSKIDIVIGGLLSAIYNIDVSLEKVRLEQDNIFDTILFYYRFIDQADVAFSNVFNMPVTYTAAD